MKQHDPKLLSQLTATLIECDTQAQHLRWAREDCASLFPITAAVHANLSERSITRIDQLVHRFSRLLDALGIELFPAIVALLHEDASRLSTSEKIVQLEALGALPDGRRWLSLNEARNRITLSLDDSAKAGREKLNRVFDATAYLLEAHECGTRFVKERLLPPALRN